jgi:ATP-dependent RNA helicase DeaD
MSSTDFKELGLSEPLLKALKDMGFEHPTEVQIRAIPHVLNGNDVIVKSKTGTGKTAVFGISLLQLTDPKEAGPQCLILEPTRELAVQVDKDLKQMARYVEHTSTAVYGQHNMDTEIRALENNITIVIGTPGRIYDHIQQDTLKTGNIRYLVLDEVDRMMDMGFIDQVRRIIRTLPVPEDRITLLFSATIPEEIAGLCRQYMKDPVSVDIESDTLTVDSIEQIYYRVEPDEKRTQLNRILLMERPKNCLIFANTKRAVNQIQNFFTRKGYASLALHGDIPQNRRLKNIEQFKKGECNILVATDVAARGIHVDDLALVINYDVPLDPDSYIHRVGRTGRAGNDGRAITLVTGEDIMTLYAIEEHVGRLIPEAELPADEELEEIRAEADAWIKANSIKIQPPKNKKTSGSRVSGNKKKTYSKPVQAGKEAAQIPDKAAPAAQSAWKTAERQDADDNEIPVYSAEDILKANGLSKKPSLFTRIFGKFVKKIE